MDTKLDNDGPISSSGSMTEHLLWLGCVGVAYFVAHQIAFLFPDAKEILMAVWPAGGIGLAALLLSPRRFWPVIAAILFISGNAANLIEGRPWTASLGFMTANVLESLACAWLMFRICGAGISFGRVREVVALIAAAVLMNAGTSFIGAGTALLVSDAAFWEFWKTWWVADGLGILVVTPVIVSWATREERLRGVRWHCMAEQMSFLILWCALAWFSFSGKTVLNMHAPPPYFLATVLIWPAFRFGPRGTTFALLLLAGIVASGRAVTAGPLIWGGDDLVHRLLLGQLYVGVMGATGLLLAASYSEARSAADAARESHARLCALEDNLPDSVVFQALRDHDGSMRFLHISAGVERLNGLTAEEVLRNLAVIRDQIIQEDRSAVRAVEMTSAQDASVFRDVVRIRRPDGEIRWVQLSASPECLPDGRLLWNGIQTDITTLKRAEEALRESEANLRAVVNATDESVFLLEADGTLLMLNEVGAQRMGGSLEELLGYNLHSLLPPEVRQRRQPFIDQALATGRHVRFEDERNGRWMINHVHPILDAGGRVVRLAVFSRDITERKEAEEALRASHWRLESIIEGTRVGTWVWNVQTGETFFNAMWARLIGYTLDELAPTSIRTWERFTHPDDLRRSSELLQRHFAGEIPYYDCECRMKHRDGRWIWVHDRGRITTRTEDGEPLLMFGTHADISERKQAEDALLAESEFNRLVVENAGEGICVCQETGEFPYVGFTVWNECMTSMTGYTMDEINRLGWYQTLYQNPELRERAVSRMQRMRMGEDMQGEEWEITRADGQTRQLLITTRLYAGAEHEPYVLAVMTDITERKREEEEKRKLETQNWQLHKLESLGRMAGAIAHHFNNKLHTVMGSLELALDVSAQSEGAVEFLLEAMRASQQASEVSGLMLTYLGQSPSNRAPWDLSELCRQNLSMLRAVVPKSVVLESGLPSPGPVVKANVNQIQQIVSNLITNAWEACEDASGIVHLTVSQAGPSDIAEAHRFPVGSGAGYEAYACLEVADNGCGIAAKDIDRLFDPFFSNKFTGRGMGLAVVIGIVRTHEGLITVESTPGKGSRFRVYLPLASGEVPLPRKEEHEAVPITGGGLVLVVEDEEEVRELSAAMLNYLGFGVLSARDGVEAVEIFGQHTGQIRCVLCDVSMPRMDGWETLEALRRITPGIPVILASGYNEEQVLEGDHSELPQAFIRKPYLREQLREAMGKALGLARDDGGSV